MTLNLLRSGSLSRPTLANRFPLDVYSLPVLAAYSTRRLSSRYSGPILRVRNSTNSTEADIGVDENGNLDLHAVLNHVDAPLRPLDRFTANHVAAFGLRRLRIGYRGPLIRVRRSSDNAESDIGYDRFGQLDTASLLAFVGANNGLVTTWYDQTGNGRHALQTTQSSQPSIVTSGVVNVNALNNVPQVNFSGTQGFVTGSFTGSFNQITAAIGYHWVDGGPMPSNARFVSLVSTADANDNASSASAALIARSGTNMTLTSFRNGTARGSNSSPTVDAIGSAVCRYNATVATINVGGSPDLTGAFTATNFGATVELYIGLSKATPAQNLAGGLTEVIIFSTALSDADTVVLERSIMINANSAADMSVISPSAAVTTWYDQSGNGRNLTQTTTTQQPSIVDPTVFRWKTGMVGRSIGVVFDDVNDNMTTADLNLAQPLSIISAVRTNTLKPYSILFDGAKSRTGTRAIAFMRVSDAGPNGQPTAFAGSHIGFGPSGGQISNNTEYVLRWVFDGASSGGSARRTSLNTNVSGNAGTTGMVNGFVVGGSASDANLGLGSNVAEIVVLGAALTAAQRDTITHELAAYCGIPVAL